MSIVTPLYFLLGLLPLQVQPPSSESSELMALAMQLENTNPDSAIIIYRYIKNEAISQGDPQTAAQAIYYQGLVYMNMGKFDTCAQYLDQAEKEFFRLHIRDQHAKVLVAIANNYYFQGKYELALTGYQRAFDAAVKLEDPFMQARILSNQSSIFNVTQRIESALQTLRQARSIAEPLGPNVYLGDIYNNFSVNFQALYQYDSASHYAHLAAEMYDRANSDLYQALALTNLSAYLHEQSPPKLEAAKTALDKSRMILDTLNAPDIEVNYWKHLAYYHYKKRNLDLAKDYSITCLDWLSIYPDLPSEINVYEFLYKIFKEQGQIDSSLRYHEKYVAVRDTLIFDESRSQLQELQAKYESTKKDEEIALQNLTINKRTSQRNIFILTLSLAGLALWFLWYRYTRNQRLQKEKIHNLEKQQKILVMDSMLQGQEEERKRIAQDLHDGLGTLLAAARMQMQNVQREMDKLGNLKLVDKTERLIDHACKEVHRISHDMMPSALVDLGFVAAIEDLVDDIRLEQDLIFHLNLPEFDLDLDNTAALNLYRIIQEILQNILKHARANIVSLQISVSENDIELTISDDGVGFRTHEQKRGMGLNAIKSRIAYLNGKMHMDSAINQGCKYDIRIPHRRKEETLESRLAKI